MAAKQIVFSEEARRKLKNGMTVVANAVSATLGPKGRNVAIDRKFGSPTITHDGVSVAKEIELEDPFENMGAQLLKEAAQKASMGRVTPENANATAAAVTRLIFATPEFQFS